MARTVRPPCQIGRRARRSVLIRPAAVRIFTFSRTATWRAGNQAANAATYQKMTTEWRDHLKTFVEKPDLRPYFEHRVELTTDDPKREAVLALADVRLD